MGLYLENGFIELDRTFHEVHSARQPESNSDLIERLGGASSLTWERLLPEYRVVILSEAGAGKTGEIRNIARRLRKDGKTAFFLRLEYAVEDFEHAFEEGTSAEFQQWLDSSDEGWLLLDSIDEARLRSPSDFEHALRRISARTRQGMERMHVFITGRTSAWRPTTDRLVCNEQFPLAPLVRAGKSDEGDGGRYTEVSVLAKSGTSMKLPGFLVVALEDLTGEQIRRFAAGKGVKDVEGLLDAIERADAYMFAARPQDLIEVIEFWEDRGLIGTRLELMRNSIQRRLAERDQTRAEVHRMDAERAGIGAMLVAAASAMAQEQTIGVPDGAENRQGLPIGGILPDWNQRDCCTLLGRPIFDEALYGSVRFHHRSVREFLAAEWLAGLLARDSSRRAVESLLFRKQYEIDVVVPSTRPLLPWLILLDEGVRNRALRLAPELVFEGGDPAALPIETRRWLLAEICTRIAKDKTYRTQDDLSAIRRFAHPDLADQINELLVQFGSDEDVCWLLLGMVWQARIRACLGSAMHFASSSGASKYTRIAAFRAVAAAGGESKLLEVRTKLLSESTKINRELLAELLRQTKPNEEATQWLIRAVSKTDGGHEFSTDGLGDAIWLYAQKTPPSDWVRLAEGMADLLGCEPFVQRRYCVISRRYRWLAEPAARVVERLVEQRHKSVLNRLVLDLLWRLEMAASHGEPSLQDVKSRLGASVRTWPELNEALFWSEAAATRKELHDTKGERLDHFWHISLGHSLWEWSIFEPDTMLDAMRSRALVDDRLIALSLAFELYRAKRRPAALRRKLWRAAKGTPELESRLSELMRPPKQDPEMTALRRSNMRARRRSEDWVNRRTQAEASLRAYLSRHVDKLRDPHLHKPNDISDAQYRLHGAQEYEDPSRWGRSNWQSLIPKFGNEIAEAFRDGCVRYWRRNRPKLRSEGAPGNSTPFSTIFGLAGIGIEASETPNWPATMSEQDAELAARYALLELNGYPAWLRRLYEVFPQTVVRVLVGELRWEFGNTLPEGESLYVLHDVSWYGTWMWDELAPHFLRDLLQREPSEVRSLSQILKVLNGSSLSDEQIRNLAAKKCGGVKQCEHLAHWYATWVGVDADRAISSLQKYLARKRSSAERLDFAMKFVTSLLGGDRRDDSGARAAFRTASHLPVLYLMMHRYIRSTDDINRVGQGSYSPGLRDQAQAAREHLLNVLREIPGKGSFLALMDISRAHPRRALRPRVEQYARIRAARDVETGPWSVQQFVDFNRELKRTPANNSELFQLVLMRLLDLKDDLEEGDSSIASILRRETSETEVRKLIGRELRGDARGRFSVPQEEELADAKRPDIRIHGTGFDAPVPLELKLADKWSGSELFERMENQLCGDYLRDSRSPRGAFVLVFRGGRRKTWELPNSKKRVDFDGLVAALQQRWTQISSEFPHVTELSVVGIDLTARGRRRRARKLA